MKRYHILCPHQRKRNPVPYTMIANDYHPLTKRQIKKLLLVAHQEELMMEEVRWRLHQGVEGYTCPQPLQGAVAERLKQISVLLDSVALAGSYTPLPVTDDLVEQCFALMHFHAQESPAPTV